MTKNKWRLSIVWLSVAIVLFFSGTQVWGKSPCDTIYVAPDKMPVYSQGPNALSQYVRDELVSEVGRCMIREDVMITSLHVALTISSDGTVLDAVFLRPVLSENCSRKLKAKLLRMKGWSPALLNGQAVCSKFYIPISCMKWE